MKKWNIIFSLSGMALAIILISLTLGRDIIAGTKLTLASFAIVNFAGYLFILLMPVEALVPVYVAQGFSSFSLISIALLTAMVAQVINYTVGKLMSEEVIHGLIGEKRFKKLHGRIIDYGIWAILLFNLFPLASSVLSLIAGMVKFGMKRLLFYTFIGLFIKYVILVLIFNIVLF